MSEPVAIIKKKKIIKKKPVVVIEPKGDVPVPVPVPVPDIQPDIQPVFKTPIDEYIETFTELEKKAFSIAKDHLKTSFDLKRSCGFVAWNKSGGK